MDRISMSGRLGFSLDVSRDEFETLVGVDRTAARELLVKLVQSEQCTFAGDTYFPVDWNEEALAPVMEEEGLTGLDMEENLEFDLPIICPAKQHGRTLDLLNTTIDSLIEDAGYKPREVVWNLLDRGFTADELIDLHFDEKDVRGCEAEQHLDALVLEKARCALRQLTVDDVSALVPNGDDEKGAGGLWDKAGEIALNIGLEIKKERPELFSIPNGPIFAEDFGQDYIFGCLHAMIREKEAAKAQSVEALVADAQERSVSVDGKDGKAADLGKE